MIVCAGRNETFDFAYPIGVGLIESTMNLTKLIINNKPSSLLFVGSAGSYGNCKILDIVTSQTAANIELGFLEDQCYTPLEKIISCEDNQNVSHETMLIVNSSNYITTDKKSAKKFLNLGLEIENMEFFALLHIAKEYNIPVKGIFVVTNYCDDNAHKDFIDNHLEAKKILIKHIKQNKLLA